MYPWRIRLLHAWNQMSSTRLGCRAQDWSSTSPYKETWGRIGRNRRRQEVRIIQNITSNTFSCYKHDKSHILSISDLQNAWSLRIGQIRSTIWWSYRWPEEEETILRFRFLACCTSPMHIFIPFHVFRLFGSNRCIWWLAWWGNWKSNSYDWIIDIW